MDTNPKAFAQKMRKLLSGDYEVAHMDMDLLILDLLRELGYEEAVEVFISQDKWYA
jgi:hypothetical protein